MRRTPSTRPIFASITWATFTTRRSGGARRARMSSGSFESLAAGRSDARGERRSRRTREEPLRRQFAFGFAPRATERHHADPFALFAQRARGIARRMLGEPREGGVGIPLPEIGVGLFQETRFPFEIGRRA